DEPGFGAWLAARGRDQVVIAGMETHVCVMQTALALAADGYRVFVAADATGSRAIRADDRRLALDRMRASGCTIAGTETILFEWCGGVDDPAFRDTLAIVKSLP
ncbi:MAG: isochorismatase family protein, partial [Burkholderiales bacterium]|nr:isochorismatase family protein [Burkholderiales bacterium]